MALHEHSTFAANPDAPAFVHRFTAAHGITEVACNSLWSAWDAALLLLGEPASRVLHLRSKPYSLEEANRRLRGTGAWIEAVS